MRNLSLKKAILLTIAVVIVAGTLKWMIERFTYDVKCVNVPTLTALPYTEEELVLKAMALSYLVYGCDGCTSNDGTVSEMLRDNTMGIIAENAGIKRNDETDPSSAVFDSAEFIRVQAGEMSFLTELRDEKSGFYGAAFIDQKQKCIWISFEGSVDSKDTAACLEYVLSPKLSDQEQQALRLFDSVASTPLVQQGAYRIVLTGHSLGGAFATFLSCASGCKAVTINGADGIAADKYYQMERPKQFADSVTNYMTDVNDGEISFLGFVQRLMYLGSYKEMNYHVYAKNSHTTDPHGVFSFIQFENGDFTKPKLP